MRVKRDSLFAVVFAVVVVSLIAGCSGSSKMGGADSSVASQDVLASYAGQVLTVTEFEQQYAKTVGSWEVAAEDSLAAYNDFLSRYVDFRLKVVDAVASGVDQDSALVAELEQYRGQLARPYLLKTEVVDDLVKDLFEKQQVQISASHILVQIPGAATPADTLAAYQRIVTLRDSVLAGEDFNDIAARNSDDPSAKNNLGNLGTFSGGRLILAFEDRAYNTPVGDVSDAFRTRFGYHIVFVHSREQREPDISASHILIRTTGEDTTEAWAKVQEVQAALDSGEPFADVAREYSDDTGSGENGGSLGSFGRGRMVPAFEEAAFALEEVGDRSDWFRTRFGYHIVQLDGIGELPTFEEAYDDLRSRVERLPRFKVAEQQLGLEYRESLGSDMDTLALDSLTADFPPDSVLFFLAMQQWEESSRSTVIAHVGPSSFTFANLLDYGLANRAARLPSYSRDEMYKLLDRMLNDESVDVAASTLEERDSTFATLMQEYRDGIILFRAMEDSVWNKASSDSVGMAEHYRANAASYTFPERRRVVSFTADNDSLLGVLASSWTPGDTSWSSQFGSASSLQLDTTHVAGPTNSNFDQVLGLAAGETVGPIPYRTGFVVLGVDGIEAPRPKTMDEARADVLSEYQVLVEQAWLERLRARHQSKLFPENLTHVFVSSDASESGLTEEPE